MPPSVSGKPRPALPVEICWAIIDFAAAVLWPNELDDILKYRKLFMSCSLVCRNWRVYSQKKLFKRVFLHCTNLHIFEALVRPQTETAKVFRSWVREFSFGNCDSLAPPQLEAWKVKPPEVYVSRAIQLALQLPNIMAVDIATPNIVLEPPILFRLPRQFGHITLLNVNLVDPVRMTQLAHLLAGFPNVHELVIEAEVERETRSRPLKFHFPNPSHSLRSLRVLVKPGCEQLIIWLASTHSIVERLKIGRAHV